MNEGNDNKHRQGNVEIMLNCKKDNRKQSSDSAKPRNVPCISVKWVDTRLLRGWVRSRRNEWRQVTCALHAVSEQWPQLLVEESAQNNEGHRSRSTWPFSLSPQGSVDRARTCVWGTVSASRHKRTEHIRLPNSSFWMIVEDVDNGLQSYLLL